MCVVQARVPVWIHLVPLNFHNKLPLADIVRMEVYNGIKEKEHKMYIHVGLHMQVTAHIQTSSQGRTCMVRVVSRVRGIFSLLAFRSYLKQVTPAANFVFLGGCSWNLYVTKYPQEKSKTTRLEKKGISQFTLCWTVLDFELCVLDPFKCGICPYIEVWYAHAHQLACVRPCLCLCLRTAQAILLHHLRLTLWTGPCMCIYVRMQTYIQAFYAYHIPLVQPI